MAALILAAIAPMDAQDFNKLNDTTWVRQFVYSDGVVTEYAYQVDQATHMAKLNNDMRTAALYQAGALGCGFACFGAAALNSIHYEGKSKFLNATTIVFGLAGLGFEIASIDKLCQKRVYMSPEGVVIRIGRVDKPQPHGQRGIFSK